MANYWPVWYQLDMKTVHFFAFYPHNLLKITDFSPWGSMNLKNTKSLHFDENGWRYYAASPFFRCSISPLQMRNQSFSNFNFRIFEFLLFFMIIYFCFHDEVVQYRLNPHGYCFDFVSDVDCNIFLPRIQNFQARKILVSSRENFTFLTKTNYIPAENQVHSGKEWSTFS